MYGVELGNKQCCLFVFTGGSAVLESPADPDDLFNLELVCTAVVDVVSNSGESEEEGSINGLVIGERDGHLHSPEWFGLNGGVTEWTRNAYYTGMTNVSK